MIVCLDQVTGKQAFVKHPESAITVASAWRIVSADTDELNVLVRLALHCVFERGQIRIGVLQKYDPVHAILLSIRHPTASRLTQPACFWRLAPVT